MDKGRNVKTCCISESWVDIDKKVLGSTLTMSESLWDRAWNGNDVKGCPWATRSMILPKVPLGRTVTVWRTKCSFVSHSGPWQLFPRSVFLASENTLDATPSILDKDELALCSVGYGAVWVMEGPIDHGLAMPSPTQIHSYTFSFYVDLPSNGSWEWVM
ncbi:hypothetical protein N657DRAFT_638474 [Parathielavia appendiculata]|uniref:Uncharacterized protein n=1 Tax=Parathielavia appendiculata TaxID=2587402 RepID=A0AAN6U7U2_9PEZI|nr:hypothetical protein N657DRAFT_638474 [Parathielavia appendiculata]